jgi:hypothetical protein
VITLPITYSTPFGRLLSPRVPSRPGCRPPGGESVQHVWEKPCLITELLARFKALWDRVTDPTAGPRSTRVRALTAPEAVAAVEELIALAVQTAVTANQAPPDVRLANLGDLT